MTSRLSSDSLPGGKDDATVVLPEMNEPGKAPVPLPKKGKKARVSPASPGDIIAGRYRVERRIARGGMATVYLARQLKLNRQVALKILSPPPEAEDLDAFDERFRLEAQTLAQLSHSNIVTLFDYGEIEETQSFFLAMEYVDGPRFTDVLKGGPLEVQNALNLILQVAAGLRYAHKRGVVHRDLKPSNLLIQTNDDGEQQVKVVDFGLVKLSDDDQSITRAGLILGTPNCMAPEQIRGKEIDHRADIYAIGVLLFRTITGRYPFHGSNSTATMMAHLNDEIPTFYSINPDLEVPFGLEGVVQLCLQKSPDDRYPTMQALIEHLIQYVDVAPEGLQSLRTQATQSVVRPVPTVKEKSGTRFFLIAFWISLLVAVAIVGGIVIGQLVSPTVQPVVPPPAPSPPVEVAPPVVTPPAPAPEPVKEPVVEEVQAEPELVKEPEVPKPKKIKKPRVKPKVKKKVEQPKAPDPVKPEVKDPPKEAPPEGYKGMPEDLF